MAQKKGADCDAVSAFALVKAGALQNYLKKL
jgi:hypothetical protein